MRPLLRIVHTSVLASSSSSYVAESQCRSISRLTPYCLNSNGPIINRSTRRDRHRNNNSSNSNNNNKNSNNLTGYTPPPRPSPTTPAATPGGVEYSRKRQDEADAVEKRRRTQQRATDAERRGEETIKSSAVSEMERWWPEENQNWTGHMFASSLDKNKKKFDGMFVPELKEVQSQDKPLELSYEEDTFFINPDFHMADEVFDETRRFVPPPSFDPSIDEIDDDGFVDGQVMHDIQKAVDEDKRRLEAFGNPLLVEDQVDYLLEPQREGQENMQQRQEFNGFVHWGLLHGAHMILEENHDYKKAHEFVNRYMRDIDLFQKWLEHPKVRAHIQKKFGIDMHAKFDKLMALVMAMYARSKIQVYEDDPAGALKSLTACMGFITEGADLKKERHRKAIGAVLAARGMVYCKLKSFERAEDDLTRALKFVNQKRCATLYQLRAEALEAMGRIEEARLDEERAAEIWENAEVISPGMDGKPYKFVL
ncbi:uncharacterized protein TM35_000251930 [Trypanosoma theileri]|uniref:Uncharacterized protein n=1 Tax=Trypanosoma theileri TaxID=67003 RepID=A0A1X0NQD3_9TRYP|nr:uncharacterized protein TM35_000251930 [Trypanosoma theileri]ORC86897.1 hypothetical protein TM35_000251930 [Trypanosoma theileri]